MQHSINTKQQSDQQYDQQIRNSRNEEVRTNYLVQALLSCFAFFGIGAKSGLEYNSETRKIHHDQSPINDEVEMDEEAKP